MMSERGVTSAEGILGLVVVALIVCYILLFVKTNALSAKIDDINRNGQELTAWAGGGLLHWAEDTHGTLHFHGPGNMHQPPPPPPPW